MVWGGSARDGQVTGTTHIFLFGLSQMNKR